MARTSIRDFQRQRIYDSERIAFNGGIEEPDAPPDYRTVAEVQAYVDDVTATDTWKALGFSHLGMFESHPLTVKDGRGRRRGAADAFSNTIKLPRFARRRWYIMHELAHIATGYVHDFAYDEDVEEGGGWPGYTDPETGYAVLIHNVASHGPEFAGIYLYLLRGLLGDEAHDKLLAAFEAKGVKVQHPEVGGVMVPEASLVPAIDTAPEPVHVPVTDTHCLNCGQPLASPSSRSRFCSDGCRYTYHNRRRHERTEAARHKVCEVCGTEFVAKRSDARTCSARCRKRLQRQR